LLQFGCSKLNADLIARWVGPAIATAVTQGLDALCRADCTF
jgi:hypothetical protein